MSAAYRRNPAIFGQHSLLWHNAYKQVVASSLSTRSRGCSARRSSAWP